MSDEKECPEDGSVPACPSAATPEETANLGLRKKLMAIGAVLLVGTLLVNWAADPPGYCKGYRWYISDEEFVRTVIRLVRDDIARDPLAFKGSEGGGSFYADWNHYIPEPDDMRCCKVDRQETHSLINRLFGWQTVTVYIAPPDQKSGGPSSTSGLDFHFDICGVLVDSDIGMRSGPPRQGVRITTTRIGD